MGLLQKLKFCQNCATPGFIAEIGNDGYCPKCRAEIIRRAEEKAAEEARIKAEAAERQRRLAQKCHKCRKNGLEVDIEIGCVCNSCRAKYPRIRDELRGANPTHINCFFWNLDLIRHCRKRFIAFDLETTGLSSLSDSIIEISAVIFEDFRPVAEFSTLINPERKIPAQASQINGIYDADVADAPFIYEAIADFCDFVGEDALRGEIPMVAHNADFDIQFLKWAFVSCGITANIFLHDTLYMSRWMNPELYRHRLCDVANHFGIEQNNAHRAADDARVCGEIFVKMLLKREPRLIQKKAELLPVELEICEWLKAEVEAEDLNTQFYTVAAAKTYCAIKCVHEVLRIKARGKKPYVIVPSECPIPDGMETAATTKSEGEMNIRLHFTSADELHPLRDFLVDRYRSALESAREKLGKSVRDFQILSEKAAHEISL